MPSRKVKVIDESGNVIREGGIRIDDIGEKKIGNIFTKGEIVKGTILMVGFVFTTGTLWTTQQDHFKKLDGDVGIFTTDFAEYKKENESFHKLMFQRLDQKDVRIDCLNGNLRACCPSSQNC